MIRLYRTMLTASFALALTGCVSPSGSSLTHSTPPSVIVERGRSNRLIDGVGWVAGIPSKIALWDRRADNHDVSTDTEKQVVDYLEEQQLTSVLVRVNQYHPLGEWKRLATNDRIGLGWRLTGGTLETLKYTLLPGRIFGEDWYNPFTDTVHLYSDIPALGLAKAAYARDVHQRRFPGAYASVQIVPIVGMWHETLATREALRYVSHTGDSDAEEEAYRVLYPSYGSKWGAGVGSFLPFGNAYGQLGGALVGHVANGVRSVRSNIQLAAASQSAAADD